MTVIPISPNSAFTAATAEGGTELYVVKYAPTSETAHQIRLPSATSVTAAARDERIDQLGKVAGKTCPLLYVRPTRTP